jgi:hypothetical protein
MKIILNIHQMNPEEIKNLQYSEINKSIKFTYRDQLYNVNIEESLETYVKVIDNDIELINQEGTL